MNTADTDRHVTPRPHRHRWGGGLCTCPDPHTGDLGPERAAILHIAHTADHLTPDQIEQMNATTNAEFWGEDCENVTRWVQANLSAISAVAVLNNATAARPHRSVQAVKRLFDRRPHGYRRPAGYSPATALLARDLIRDRFTQEHYDLLTGPWRKVIGPVHPNDAPMHPAPAGTRP